MKLLRLLAPLLLCTVTARAANDQFVFVGTQTGVKTSSKGIYVFGLDSETGKMEPLGLAAEAKSPSFLAIAPNKKVLLPCQPVLGRKAGSVATH